MVFKQGIIKEEKIKLLIGIVCVSIPGFALCIINRVYQYDSKTLMLFLLLFFFPLFTLIVFLGIMNLEWFYIYDDRLEVRYIFGRKNVVYFEDVLFVQETIICLTSRGWAKQFYIFNDGRKNNNNQFDLNSCYNKKKFNLRIYKTFELEEYVNNVLKLQIKVM